MDRYSHSPCDSHSKEWILDLEMLMEDWIEVNNVRTDKFQFDVGHRMAEVYLEQEKCLKMPTFNIGAPCQPFHLQLHPSDGAEEGDNELFEEILKKTIRIERNKYRGRLRRRNKAATKERDRIKEVIADSFVFLLLFFGCCFSSSSHSSSVSVPLNPYGFLEDLFK